ncbi:MAG: HAD-IB family phosphatase [Thermoanaerobaculia bacterium]
MKARFELVCFDVDSTLVTIEGIDVLADGDPEVALLTSSAMNGEIPIDAVYGRRLERIRPTLGAVEALGMRYIDSLVPGALEVIAALRSAHADVHLVSAGVRQAILPLATHLGIEPRAVHAVELKFAPDGSWVDFDRRTPLTRPGGKELVVLNLRARSHGRAAFVGDGISDLETREAVDLFIGFGGVAEREAVARDAEIYVREPSLTALLPHLLEE